MLGENYMKPPPRTGELLSGEIADNVQKALDGLQEDLRTAIRIT